MKLKMSALISLQVCMGEIIFLSILGEKFNLIISFFVTNKKSQAMFERWGEQYSELTNNLDFNIIVHQSRNIVKGMQKKNNAEQLSFFENSTLEDTEVENNG